MRRLTLNERFDRLVYALALVAGALPLWAAGHLPMVDLPQHLHLISVLHRLGDPTTLYPAFFEQRGELTPYLGYYYAVSALHWLVPLDLANRLFLTAYVVGMPLSLAFLLGALGRPRWPSLLALPFAYGDSFGWGFVNYCSALPLAFVSCGLFVGALARVERRWASASGLAACLVAVLLFHVQVYVYLGLALPLLLVMTRAPEDALSSRWAERLKARRWAVLATAPSVLLFGVWVGARLGQPSEVQYGAPWKAWGPLLSPQNLSFKSPAQNWAELPAVVANLLRDGSDRWGAGAAAGVALLGLFLGLFPLTRGRERTEGPLERWRLPLLASLAFALYFWLPFDIRGYMYYLNTRYAHLAAPLLLAAVPVASARARRALLVLAAVSAVVLGVPLARGFLAFDAEARAVDVIAKAAAPRPRVMGLVFGAGSQVVTHPVYLHAAAEVARANGGITNFSFALTPHSPLKYRSEPPPTFPSEWRPDQMDYARQGVFYDHFLLRGAAPAQVFGERLGTELDVVAHEGAFWLVRRR